MKESLIICRKCGSNACSEVSNEKLTVWNCFGCGFTSNSTMVYANLDHTEEVLPEIYKALRFEDSEGYFWYPNVVTLDTGAMVFAEGIPTDWKWAAVKAENGKASMITKKEFIERDFMEALDYVGYFNQR